MVTVCIHHREHATFGEGFYFIPHINCGGIKKLALPGHYFFKLLGQKLALWYADMQYTTAFHEGHPAL